MGWAPRYVGEVLPPPRANKFLLHRKYLLTPFYLLPILECVNRPEPVYLAG